MTFKQFYLICLLCITLCGGIYLFLIWLTNFNKAKEDTAIKEINKGLFFIIIAIFSWSVVALYKFFDVKDFSLSYIINDRILSSLNNLFLISSLAFFPLKKKLFCSKYFKKKEDWLINVFIVFALIIAFFTVTDKVSAEFGLVSKLIIVALDSILSISCILGFGYILFYSFQEIFPNKLLLNFIKWVMFLFALTQIILPLTKLIPEYLSKFYPLSLCLFFVFVSLFIIIIIIYYTILVYSISLNPTKFTALFNNSDTNSVILEVNKIQIGYEINSKRFYIKLDFINKEGVESAETNYNSKLLQPYIYWALFAVAKKNNVMIYNPDIAVSKFRMVEYWNKESNNKLSQDVLFNNESGNFEFIIDNSFIDIIEGSFIKAKSSVKEIFKKHLICFLNVETVKQEQLRNKKNLEKYTLENFEKIYNSLF